MMKLRDYQKEGKEQIYDQFRNPDNNCVLYRLETGGGKTPVVASITADLFKGGKRVLLIAHRVELWRQMLDKVRAFGLHAGVIAPGVVESNHNIQVASADTLLARLRKKKHIEWRDFHPHLIVVDEGHHVIEDNKWGKILVQMSERMKNPSKILLVTATPARGDGTGLGRGHGGFADVMVEGPSVSWLMDNEFLSNYRMFLANVVDMTGVSKTASGDYSPSQLVARMQEKRAIVGDAIQEYGDRGAGAAVLFAPSVALAQEYADKFCDAGFKFKSLDGTMSDAARKKTINALTAGAIDGITSCEIVSEGTDIPRVERIISMRPTNSFGLHRQQIGRGLRMFEGKEKCIITDHVGNVATVLPDGQILERHGFPDDYVEWSLESGVVSRRSVKNEDHENARLQMRRCPVCDCVHQPVPECPDCGHEYTGREIKVMSGELQEIEKKRTEQAEKDRKKRVRLERGRQRTIEGLIELAKRQGKKTAWAYHVHIGRSKKEVPKLEKRIEHLRSQYDFFIGVGDKIQANSFMSDIEEVESQIYSYQMSFDEFMKIEKGLR